MKEIPSLASLIQEVWSERYPDLEHAPWLDSEDERSRDIRLDIHREAHGITMQSLEIRYAEEIYRDLVRQLEEAEIVIERYHNCADLMVGDQAYGEYRKMYPLGGKQDGPPSEVRPVQRGENLYIP